MGEKQMSVVITLEDIQAYAEVDYIIHHMNERYIEKVPQKLLDFFSSIKDPNYEVYVDPRKPLQSQGLKKYTLEVIAILHVKYWCENEERKAELLAKMQDNQEKFEEQLREKYSVDKLFANPSATVVSSLEDLEEKEDFSKPKSITKYVVQEENTEIEGNVEQKGEEINTKENNSETMNKEEQSKVEQNAFPQKVEKKCGFLQKLKNFFFKQKSNN